MLDTQYNVLHPFTFMPGFAGLTADTFHKSNVILHRGEGAWVYDEKGKKYLYTTTAVPSVGLGNRYVIDRITEQYNSLSFASTCAQTHDLIQPLARRLVQLTDPALSTVFFSNDGSGAIETAMKLARQHFIAQGLSQRKKFISLEGSYHGTTLGSGSVTHMGISASFGPALENCFAVPTPNLFRPPIEGNEEAIITYCLHVLEETIFEEGPDEIAAVLVEPVQGVNGIVILPEAYIREVRKMTSKYGILLIMDEVATGVGRTGSWTISQSCGIQPDFITLSKGLTGGYFPMGATLISDKVMEPLTGDGGIVLHGSTQSGHPVGCAAGQAVIDIMEDKELITNARNAGKQILFDLRSNLMNHCYVGDIRGKGLMIAIEFVSDKKSLQPVDYSFGDKVSKSLQSEGLLGNFFNGTLIMYPPLTISEEESDFLVNAVSRAINKL